MQQQLNILVTGSYKPSYNRNAVLLSGLRELGHTVVEFPFSKPYWKSRRHVINELSRNDYYDFVLMPSFTHRDVCWVKRHSSLPVVFDPLISKHLTAIYDYKKYSRYSLRSALTYYRDFTALRCADLILADTAEHARYYSETYRIPISKTAVVPVGANCNEIKPYLKNSHTSDSTQLTVGFYGGMNPLQGVPAIIQAMAQLKGCNFRTVIIGDGFEYDRVKEVTEYYNLDIEFTGRISMQSLYAHISSFDICLGIFGNTRKADLVIPNKIFHYAAFGKPIISKDTPAVRELFTNNENILLTDSSPTAIADAINQLAGNSMLRKRLGNNARHLICGSYNHVDIANMLVRAASKRQEIFTNK